MGIIILASFTPPRRCYPAVPRHHASIFGRRRLAGKKQDAGRSAADAARHFTPRPRTSSMRDASMAEMPISIASRIAPRARISKMIALRYFGIASRYAAYDRHYGASLGASRRCARYASSGHARRLPASVISLSLRNAPITLIAHYFLLFFSPGRLFSLVISITTIFNGCEKMAMGRIISGPKGAFLLRLGASPTMG